MINRRDWMRLTGVGVLTSLLSAKYSPQRAIAQTTGTGVTIQWLGHSCFLCTGNNLRVLSNPFEPLGCTANYPAPRVNADVVMISSRLLDEGAAGGLPNNPQLMVEPGVYEVGGIRFQGIRTFHDRQRGRRFGENIVWRWNQGGVNILHLGGIASPIDIEQRILMGSPDVAMIPIGGGPKNYNPQEAMDAIRALQPKVVFPTQYLTNNADPNSCDLVPLEEFLTLARAEELNINTISGNQTTIRPQDLPQRGTLIRVFR
ncbi:hypothetical protein Cyast_0110 [Cyanobacterium stanieri PCC 7202]|uniref:Zn-dependent hydrolase of the beta-lactamase fold-like protein n=1 Tax=Cyanobacterium stanieri (strain ATCC 29140 / PCC 7202) TaxID=292563 RepID=K9YJ19_CYASC|nr:hypothetical protein Cyast_0110 [Cyanobacterium stanieri PCC 7202]